MFEFTHQAINHLQMSVRGRVIQPGQDGYDAARMIWNGMIERNPALVVQCVGTADVVACVNFARINEIPFTVRGGGHNIAGLAVADDAMMIDLSHMRGAWVDHERQTVNAQPGATLGDIDRETQMHGLAAVLGFVSNTGATGLTLGGGFGYLTRRYGWTCDNVESMDMVTAEGEWVRASEMLNPELLWGLRGGGGNFGVVTNIEHRLHPVGPDITGGVIAWRAEDTEDVLEIYRELTASAPRDLACAALIRKAPPAPWLSEHIHGKQIIGVVVCHCGSAEQAENDLAPLKDHGSPVGDVVQLRPYTQQQSLLDATQPNGRRYYWKSEYLPRLDSASLAAYRKCGDAVESPHSAAILFAIDGALNELPDEYSAVGNRDAKFVLNLTASWDSPDEDEVHIGWARRSWNDMRQFSTGGTYVNFLTEDDGEDRVRAAYGNGYDRLVEAKSKWDPHNFFSKNKNIAPKKAGS